MRRTPSLLSLVASRGPIDPWRRGPFRTVPGLLRHFLVHRRARILVRFQREAQAVAKFNHPGIAGIHFIGKDRHVCYMAMEFIDGVTIRAIIDRLAESREPTSTFDRALEDLDDDEGEGQALEARFDGPTPAKTAPPDSLPDAKIAREQGNAATAKQMMRSASRSHVHRINSSRAASSPAERRSIQACI
jgi:hypothetical protein